jgi:hypothetical protein
VSEALPGGVEFVADGTSGVAPITVSARHSCPSASSTGALRLLTAGLGASMLRSRPRARISASVAPNASRWARVASVSSCEPAWFAHIACHRASGRNAQNTRPVDVAGSDITLPTCRLTCSGKPACS